MKCPKCGYIGFETSNSCRKCSNDLVAFRQTHGLTPIVLPAAVRASMAKSLGAGEVEEQAAHETANDSFSFDLPQHEEPQAPAAPSDPFDFASGGTGISFDTPAPAAQDPFAELLESTPTAAKAAAAPQETAGQGFELNSFSWDDAPEPTASGTAPQQASPKKTDDDFSSLFGDLGKPEQKP
jgi:hypothetical protein